MFTPFMAIFSHKHTKCEHVNMNFYIEYFFQRKKGTKSYKTVTTNPEKTLKKNFYKELHVHNVHTPPFLPSFCLYIGKTSVNM